MEDSQIQSFYKSRNVFITGGTGFIGKVLIEKLLRSTEVSTIYLLVREKKGRTVDERVDKMFDDVIFNVLKKECPKYKHRIDVISGDCTMPDLGLCMQDKQTLMSKIDIVFHIAANVRFNECLKLAYMINVNGTKEILKLARQMTNLKSLIYVSTAYANCPYDEIEEKVYNSIRYDYVETLIEKMGDEEDVVLTSRILENHPNTYTFTKSLAESLIKDTGGGLPIGIFRPSIVISTYKEPLAGWIDNLYGPSGMIAAAFLGVVRVIFCDRENIPDLVPVDSCVAGLIATAWDISTNESLTETSNHLPVYNYVSSVENPITWNEFVELNMISLKSFPSSNSLWDTFVIMTPNVYWNKVLQIFYHTLPGLLIDFVTILSGKRPRMMRLYKTTKKSSDAISYFATRSWKFSNDNIRNLWQKMNRTDQKLFPLSITTVHWLIYFRSYLRGIRLYLLREPEDTLEAARRRYVRMRRCNTALKWFLIYIIYEFALKLLSYFHSYMF
nr:fatty acyl-CoA reductase wat-like [Leptinotarsa decemlineata]